jgi:hypothetical protein
MQEQHGVVRVLKVKNGLRRYYNNFNYCNYNAGDSPHGAIPPIIKLLTTYLPRYNNMYDNAASVVQPLLAKIDPLLDNIFVNLMPLFI